MRTLTVIRAAASSTPSDALVYFIPEDPQARDRLAKELVRLYRIPPTPVGQASFRGTEGETLLLFPAHPKIRRIILAGVGRIETVSAETFRRASSSAARLARSSQARTLVIAEPDATLLNGSTLHGTADPWETFAFAVAEGVLLGTYRYEKYISTRKTPEGDLRSLVALTQSASRKVSMTRGFSTARIVCEGTTLARDLANAPGNEIYPSTLAAHARRLARKAGFSVRIMNERDIRRLNMGGLLAVSQGSARPPRFIVLEHNRQAGRKGRIALVGKGVTFDSGGISIKPSAGMAEMKMDMAGAAAVLATVYTAARLKIPVHLIGLIPATENLPGGKALKPGDIVRHLTGLTSEVDNTDAEGRLILADALGYGTRYKPDLMIDLATLTGACVVALGHEATGMMGNCPSFMSRLQESGETTYERVWPLPLFKEYERLIKSDIADLKNVGGRWAGAITAAVFLKKFVGDTSWIHLDIAGPAIMEEPFEYIPKGASGVGVRVLIDFLRNWKKG